MEFAVVVVALLAAAAPVVYMSAIAVDRTIDVFGAGFVPFRTSGWPRGVQEDDPPVDWQWRPPATETTLGAVRPSDTEVTAEIVELYDGDLLPPGGRTG